MDPADKKMMAPIGPRIAEIRKRRGMSQDDLGAVAGVRGQQISRWETVKAVPGVFEFWRLAKALGVTVEHLIDPNNATPAADERDARIASLEARLNAMGKEHRSAAREKHKPESSVRLSAVPRNPANKE